ncbi:hypothetical protein AHiyo8_46560 [Arthrobacter sp. Hiyo8]|nr:hypothetical protein AHiyo8_46560 [Arthrobacter sp. Hiyo8]
MKHCEAAHTINTALTSRWVGGTTWKEGPEDCVFGHRDLDGLGAGPANISRNFIARPISFAHIRVLHPSGAGWAVPNGWLVLMAPSLVAIGMVLRRPSNDGEIARQATNPDLHRFLKTTFWILAVLAVLHFALAGIPVLSDSVETQRFSLGSSGLGGFPSRAVLYAIPAVALISLATVTIQTRRTTIAIWILFSITQIGLGFKGGLLEVMFLAALAYLVRVARPGPSISCYWLPDLCPPFFTWK